MTRTPIMRLAVHLDRASEIREPPKPKIAAKTSKPPVPPCIKCTPNTFSTMNSTRLSSARTARLVTTNRKMRFMGASVREKEPQYGNAALTNGRDVAVQFQATVFGQPTEVGFAIDRRADSHWLCYCKIED